MLNRWLVGAAIGLTLICGWLALYWLLTTWPVPTLAVMIGTFLASVIPAFRRDRS